MKMSDLKHSSQPDLLEIWNALDGPVYYVMESDVDDAVNVACHQVRHFFDTTWLSNDNIDGWQLVEEDDVETWDLATIDDPRIRNEWAADGTGRVFRDGEVISDRE
jgi:hypothetical protein